MQWIDYEAPTTVEEAVAAFQRHGSNARALAGGTDLLVQMRAGRRDNQVVIDLKKIPALNDISWDPAKGLTLGADVPCYEIYADEKASIAAIVATFKGKTIGVQTSTTHENFLNEFLKADVDIKSYDTQENLDLDLQAGRVDAALASMSYWVPLLESDKGADMAMVGPAMTGGPFGAGVGVGIRQKDQALADKFTAAINAAIADGTVKKLAVQWFGFDASSK